MGEIPEVIGKYKVSGIVAKGGMGVVFKAVHPSLKRDVVIKKMTGRGSPEARERFKREAQILLDMQNPYIVHLFDYFTEGSYRYMVEEFVDGMALDKLIKKEKKLGTQLSLLILLDACYALKYAHLKGVVHRDIKPGNILISKRAEIKLTDFGIASDENYENTEKPSSTSVKTVAKVKNADTTVAVGSVTQAGTMLGTPAYMPPEQFADSRSVDKRADIYALGVMLYEMTTGLKPFPVTNPEQMVKAVQKGKYVKPSKIDKSIDSVVDRLVRKMLKANPSHRFQSVDPIIKIVRGYFKKYDAHQIRILLAKLIISSNSLKIPEFEEKKNIVKRISLSVLAAATFCTALYFLWITGGIHRTILRHWFTPVTITMEMPETHGTGLPVYAYFFVNDNDKIPEVSGTQREFFKTAEGKAGIKNVYLRPGEYRIKIVAGPYVWWESETVGQDDKTFSYDFLKKARRPLVSHITAFDSVSGKDITADSNITILYNNKWISIKDIPSDRFFSGTVWKIRISCDGYETELFSLLIDWYQDELFICANLHPSL